MRYRTLLRMGLPVGSGIVESAHRHVLQVRMKRAGQRWGIQRARRMVRLRAVYRTAGAHHFHRAIRAGLKSSTLRAEQLRLQPNSSRRVVHNYTRSRFSPLNRAAAAAASK